MAEPFLGELRLMSFGFPPKGWALCAGQLLPLNQNQALFSLLGTMYGGDGQTTFALPDLRGRAPMHVGGGWVQGDRPGTEAHTLTQAELPAHTHALNASSLPADTPQPGMLGAGENLYRRSGDLTALDPRTVTTVGGSQPHENRAPALVLNWCIALIGIFPSRN